MAAWSSNPQSPCHLNWRSCLLFSCNRNDTPNDHTRIQWEWNFTVGSMWKQTSVSAPAWVSLPPVVEGWGWRWCPLLLLLAGRPTSHYCISVKFSSSSNTVLPMSFSMYSSPLTTNRLLLWCAGSLWHQNWLQLLGRDSPHPELHSNSHSSLLQTLQVWTVATKKKKRNCKTCKRWRHMQESVPDTDSVACQKISADDKLHYNPWEWSVWFIGITDTC